MGAFVQEVEGSSSEAEGLLGSEKLSQTVEHLPIHPRLLDFRLTCPQTELPQRPEDIQGAHPG